MPLNGDLSQANLKGRGGKFISHARNSSVDVDSSQPKFPRIEDCAHFHYEAVDHGRIKVAFVEETGDGLRLNGSLNIEGFNPAFNVRITCKENTWVVRRNLAHFETLDEWLHECVFDRKFSHLPLLRTEDLKKITFSDIQSKLENYLAVLSAITDKVGGEVQIFCAPVLHWLEIDNHGRNLAPHALGDVADINIPAIAAARVVRRYQAQDDDELNLDVGDMVSIIEMGVSGWWRGKQGLKVGSFPSQCVRRINSATDVVATHERLFSPPSYTTSNQNKPIARKHGKFMDFLRSFLDTRPSKSHLKKKGILRERVFGCDLGELLHRTDQDVPTVVSDCTRFVEKHGIVDGIYRISGVSSHIRHLKYEFDSDRRPDLENDLIDLPKLGNVPGLDREVAMRCDPHSVAGLCKLYFRELPNPLLTYQLYNRFASAVSDYEAEERLLKVHDVVQQLPPPHYRTLKHLINHLRFMAQQDGSTSMHSRNLAIVWAPNLLRSREIEAGLAAFTEARVQSVVTEFLIVNGDMLFSEELQTVQYDAEHKPLRPRSLMILPTPKLISLEEAQARSKSGVVTPTSFQSPAADTLSGVRLRNPVEKSSSSNEKRKRHKKSTSVVTGCVANSPHPGRPSKKHGHRHTASCSESFSRTAEPVDCLPQVTPLRTGGANGVSKWKDKLGSLLKKNTAQNRPGSKQGSLRRAQSYDSLISSYDGQRKTNSSKKKSEFNKAIKSSLNRAMSCDDAGISDRGLPEPQVPHTGPTALPHVKAPYIESLKHGDTSKNCSDNSYLRCSSPFCALDGDFPHVMDENGLDFDPLSYGVTGRKFSLDKCVSVDFSLNVEDAESHNGGQNLRPNKMALGKSLSHTDSSVQCKRSSVESSTVFRPAVAATCTGAASNGNEADATLKEDQHASRFGRNVKGSKAGFPLRRNQSLNNNTEQECSLDTLTADSFANEIPSTREKNMRLSAAARLGLKNSKKSAPPHSILKKSPKTLPCGQCMAPQYNNATTSQSKSSYVSQQSETNYDNFGSSVTHSSTSDLSKDGSAGRKVSVQVFDLPVNNALKRDDLYGSLIALVGSNNSSGNPEANFIPCNPDAAYAHSKRLHCHEKAVSQSHAPTKSKASETLKMLPQPSNFRPFSSFRNPSPKPPNHIYEPGSFKTEHTYRSGNPFCFDVQPISANSMYQSKLETFSPEGKRREDYPYPPLGADKRFLHPQSLGNPMQLQVDYQPQNDQQPLHSHCLSYQQQFPIPQWHPNYNERLPDPDYWSLSAFQESRNHGRSYSVGNAFDSQMGNFHHVTERQQQMTYASPACERQTAFVNRAYENVALGQKQFCETASGNLPYLSPNAHASIKYTHEAVARPSQYDPLTDVRGTACYELNPIYYEGKGRYDFPAHKRRPAMITSVPQTSVPLSWV